MAQQPPKISAPTVTVEVISESDEQATERRHVENLTANVLIGLLASQALGYEFPDKETAITAARQYVMLIKGK